MVGARRRGVRRSDENGTEVPQVPLAGSCAQCPVEGYTGGGKQINDGLLSSGDVGYLTSAACCM